MNMHYIAAISEALFQHKMHQMSFDGELKQSPDPLAVTRERCE